MNKRNKNKHKNRLFRSDTIATKILATFCRIEGDAYLRNLLQPSLRFLENVNIEGIKHALKQKEMNWIETKHKQIKSKHKQKQKQKQT